MKCIISRTFYRSSRTLIFVTYFLIASVCGGGGRGGGGGGGGGSSSIPSKTFALLFCCSASVGILLLTFRGSL